MDRILAIVKLRFLLMWRSASGGSRAVRVAAAAIMVLVATILAAGIAVGFGALTHFAIRGGQEQGVRVAFLVAMFTFFFFALVLPVLSGTMNPGLDLSSIRVFPISRGKLYGITLAASAWNAEHLLYYPSMLAIAFTGVVLPGVDRAYGMAVLASMVLFYVGWGNAVTLLLANIMKKRRMREIVALAVMTLVVAAAFAPALLEDRDGDVSFAGRPGLGRVVRVVGRAATVLPPSIAADALASLQRPDPRRRGTRLAALVAWDAAGFALGYRLFSRSLLGERGRTRAPARRRRSPRGSGAARRPRASGVTAFAFLPDDIRAVAAKELCYLFRSVVGKLNLIMMPLFVVFVLLVMARGASWTLFGLVTDELTLFGLLAYTALFSNNFVNNAFAWEGEGIRAYFLYPVGLHRILAGKNLGVWAYNCVLLAIMLATWSLIKGLPSPATLASAVILYAACILCFTITGNIVSVLFPVARDISSVHSSPSQVGVLLAFASLSGAIVLIGLFLLVPFLLDLPSLRPVFLLALFALAVGGYGVGLRLAARLMEDRREQLVETLKTVR